MCNDIGHMIYFSVGFEYVDYRRIEEYRKLRGIKKAGAAARELIRKALDLAEISPDPTDPFCEPLPNAVERAVKQPADAHGEDHKWRQQVLAYLKDRNETTISEVLIGIGARDTQNEKVKIGRFLRDNGFLKLQKRIGKERYWMYRVAQEAFRRTEAPAAAGATPNPTTYTSPMEDFAKWTSDIGVGSMIHLEEALERDVAALALKTEGEG